jgi:hypothetical protein
MHMGRDIRGFEVRIASPCTVEWSSMSGTERVRFCGLCQKNVYELSGLTRDEVLALLAANPDVCVTFFQRDDGTVLTADCAVGERLARGARRALWVARGAALGLAGMAMAGLVGGVSAMRARESLAQAARRAATEESPFVWKAKRHGSQYVPPSAEELAAIQARKQAARDRYREGLERTRLLSELASRFDR